MKRRDTSSLNDGYRHNSDEHWLRHTLVLPVAATGTVAMGNAVVIIAYRCCAPQ
jgi:hypothetical protein